MGKLTRPQLRSRASKIRLAAFDIDGVMTDGLLYLGPEGQEFKATSVKDGHGLVMLRKAGVELAVISGRPSAAMAGRCAELGFGHVYLGVHDKLGVFNALLARLQLTAEQACYMGDDTPDLPILQACGLAFAPADALAPVLDTVHWVSQFPGGRGAVREACDLLLTARAGESTP